MMLFLQTKKPDPVYEVSNFTVAAMLVNVEVITLFGTFLSFAFDSQVENADESIF